MVDQDYKLPENRIESTSIAKNTRKNTKILTKRYILYNNKKD